MNKELLQKHITSFLKKLNKEPEKLKTQQAERYQRIEYYQSWTKERILAMTEEDLLE